MLDSEKSVASANETPRRHNRWYNAAVMLFKLAVAAGIIAILVSKANIKLENFAELRWGWIVAALAAILAQNVLTGLRWWALMRGVGIRVRRFDAVSLTMQGLFFTLFIPGGSVSGDVVKAGLIAKNMEHGAKFNAVFSILVDRICGLCGLLLLAFFTSAYAFFHAESFSPMLQKILLAVLIACPAALLCALAAFRCDLILKVSLFRKLYAWADRLTHGAVSKIEAALAAYRSAWKTVLWWAVISGGIAFPLIAFSVWLIALAVLQGIGSSAAAVGSLLAGSIGELVGILPLTPGGIGVRDMVFMEIFKAYGFDAEQSTMIPVVFTTLFILASSTGALFCLWSLLHTRKR